MLQVFEFLLSPVVVGQQLFHQCCILGCQWLVVWIPAEDIFEQALDLVDVRIFLSSELKLFYFLAADSASTFLLSFLFLVVLLSKIVNDAIVMMTMLLPKLIQLLSFCLLHFQSGFSYF